MCGIGTEEDIEICATIRTNKTKCKSTNVMKRVRNCEDMKYTPLVPSVEQNPATLCAIHHSQYPIKYTKV
jgi:hypothetical protein